MADLRRATPADAAGVATVYAPYVLGSPATFDLDLPAVQAVADRIAGPLPWWVAVEAGVVVGYAYASPHHERAAYAWSVDCTVYLAPSAGGRGLGRRLYDVLLADLRDHGYVSAYAKITKPNAASEALHAACGFAPVGVLPQVGYKLGAWHDVGLWALALVDPPPVPPPAAGPGRPADRP